MHLRLGIFGHKREEFPIRYLEYHSYRVGYRDRIGILFLVHVKENWKGGKENYYH